MDAARAAFNTTWGMNVDATERAARESRCCLMATDDKLTSVINKLADLIERDASRLAALER